MKSSRFLFHQLLVAVLALVLSGFPQMLQAQQAPAQNPAEPPQNQQDQTAPPAATPGKVDPAQGPLQPAESNPPSSPQKPAEQESLPPAPAPQQSQSQPQQPAGAAVGQAGTAAGGPASRPAGNAIAPAKQRQSRSLLLKVGAIAATGIALGVVVGLTRGTSSKPPGAR